MQLRKRLRTALLLLAALPALAALAALSATSANADDLDVAGHGTPERLQVLLPFAHAAPSGDALRS